MSPSKRIDSSSIAKCTIFNLPHKYRKRHILHHYCCNQFIRNVFFGFLLMQQVKLFECRHTYDTEDGESLKVNELNKGREEKRTLYSNIAAGHPEEIFDVGNQMKMNYDEYPMVVPKRASLLLDRLMVALHRALQKEHQRLSDNHSIKTVPSAMQMENDIENKFDRENHMYNDDDNAAVDDDADGDGADDDSSLTLDYDFKDLSSINQAIGETLMQKSFQRRGNIDLDFISGSSLDNNIGLKNMMSILSPAYDETNSIGKSRSSGTQKSFGAKYWRCYFNAVSCF